MIEEYLVILFLSCTANNHNTLSSIPTGEGTLQVDGGNIWYKVTGAGTSTPLVLLHGGPGFSSVSLKPFEELGNSRKVVRYDQLGSGKSEVISDSSKFTVRHFVDELESLRKHLEVAQWHVLGHSWGAMLAMEYYRKYSD